MYKVFHQGNHIHDLTDEQAGTAWPGGRIESFDTTNKHHIVSKSEARKEIVIEFYAGPGIYLKQMTATIWLTFSSMVCLGNGLEVTAYTSSLGGNELIQVTVPAKWVRNKQDGKTSVTVNPITLN